MTQLEKDIERKLRKKIESLGGQCLKWVCPGWSGVPDRIILLPGGRIVFAELKRPKGGKISSMQIYWRDKLQDLGFPVLFIFTEQDVDDASLLLYAEIMEGKK
jgi:hypothetical protein